MVIKNTKQFQKKELSQNQKFQLLVGQAADVALKHILGEQKLM